jgi:hypothetical protein
MQAMRWICLLLVLAINTAEARSEKTLAYPRDQAWAAAVRFLVVDEHVKVTDKDEGAGYVLFDLHDDGKSYRGSLELIVFERDGRKVVRFVVQIEDRPSWLEIKMLERLEIKLRRELGSPSPEPTKPAPPPKDDKDKDKPAPPPKDDDGPPISNTP